MAQTTGVIIIIVILEYRQLITNIKLSISAVLTLTRFYFKYFSVFQNNTYMFIDECFYNTLNWCCCRVFYIVYLGLPYFILLLYPDKNCLHKFYEKNLITPSTVTIKKPPFSFNSLLFRITT